MRQIFYAYTTAHKYTTFPRVTRIRSKAPASYFLVSYLFFWYSVYLVSRRRYRTGCNASPVTSLMVDHDESRPLIYMVYSACVVFAFSYTDGWVRERTSGPLKHPVPLIPKDSSIQQMEVEETSRNGFYCGMSVLLIKNE